MIKSIKIKNIVPYTSATEEPTDLRKINFIYGSNGTGKTAIAQIIADCDTSLIWHGEPVERLVYNRDFVNRIFNQSDKIKGIFTLGEKDKDTLDKIEVANTELGQIKANIVQLKTTLNGENGDGGKIAELKELETDFEEKCWEIKLKHDEKLRGAFAGLRGSKADFKAKLIEESTSNSSATISLTDIEKKAESVFAPMPKEATYLMVSGGTDLLSHETNSILKKKVIGKTDVNISALIEKLGNSDWVKQGREFYNPEQLVCPFCQQETLPSLEHSLNDYFDDAFATDTTAIEKLYNDYKSDSEQVQQSVKTLLDNPSNFLDANKLQAESDILDSKILLNIRHIEKKRRESSKSIDLESLKNSLGEVETLIAEANSKIKQHNEILSNLDTERMVLTGQVWRYLLDHEIKSDLATFERKKVGIENAIKSIEEKIRNKTEEQQATEQNIQNLEKNTTSIQPTIDGINELLQSSGFTSFALAKSDQERFYKIQRSDGTDVKKTLSEGESSFISFLYFYHLLRGSETETGMTSDRVVVFDDPVSSLDSDTLFIVSSLIKNLFNEIRKDSGTIKQAFVMTHNVYFHKEVSFDSNRHGDHRLKDETFWTIIKSNQGSKIRCHETNPIRTPYDLLWGEIKNSDRNIHSIQNTMRRILEYYYMILGNVDHDTICAHFEGAEKLICRSLFSWVHAGSHFDPDPLSASIDTSTVDNYLRVFKQIFDETGHIAHYDMMMGEVSTEEYTEIPAPAAP